MATYSSASPWYKTPITNNHLNLLTIRPVSAETDDFFYTIEAQYAYRPDLLAFDLYGDAKLWWVFIQRNLNALQDPILDFVPGKQIYICKKTSLMKALGL